MGRRPSRPTGLALLINLTNTDQFVTPLDWPEGVSLGLFSRSIHDPSNGLKANDKDGLNLPALRTFGALLDQIRFPERFEDTVLKFALIEPIRRVGTHCDIHLACKVGKICDCVPCRKQLIPVSGKTNLNRFLWSGPGWRRCSRNTARRRSEDKRRFAAGRTRRNSC